MKPHKVRRVTTGAIYENLSDGEMLIEWDTHFGAESYDVWKREEEEPDFKPLLVSTAVNSYTLYGLRGNVEFKIKAKNFCGIEGPNGGLINQQL